MIGSETAEEILGAVRAAAIDRILLADLVFKPVYKRISAQQKLLMRSVLDEAEEARRVVAAISFGLAQIAKLPAPMHDVERG